MSTVAEEKKYNTRLTKKVGEFEEIMENLNLPYPKEIGKCSNVWLRSLSPSVKHILPIVISKWGQSSSVG